MDLANRRIPGFRGELTKCYDDGQAMETRRQPTLSRGMQSEALAEAEMQGRAVTSANLAQCSEVAVFVACKSL